MMVSKKGPLSQIFKHLYETVQTRVEGAFDGDFAQYGFDSIQATVTHVREKMAADFVKVHAALSAHFPHVSGDVGSGEEVYRFDGDTELDAVDLPFGMSFAMQIVAIPTMSF
jgi:hypothetical protein